MEFRLLRSLGLRDGQARANQPIERTLQRLSSARLAIPMHALLLSLCGGDRRSVGESSCVVSAVFENPELIGILFEGLETSDPVLRMRCADAIEKVTSKLPALLVPYKKIILQHLSKIEQQEVRWHVAPILARLPLTEAEENTVVNLLLSFTNDRSSIVKTMSMQALADIALRSHRLMPKIKQHIEALSVSGTPAMKARSKNFSRRLHRLIMANSNLGPLEHTIETLKDKIARVVKEEVAVVPYDPRWPEIFEHERLHLLSCLPADLIRRIEHFGSTAVPGLSAKPIVDILVEVASLDDTKHRVVPILEAQGYEYFWRPSWGDDTPPFYAWFIKRDKNGNRTHHIHMVEPHFEHWDRLLFRDYLIEHPDVAMKYGNVKIRLSATHHNDRVAYTQAKSDFISRVMATAKQAHAPKDSSA